MKGEVDQVVDVGARPRLGDKAGDKLGAQAQEKLKELGRTEAVDQDRTKWQRPGARDRAA